MRKRMQQINKKKVFQITTRGLEWGSRLCIFIPVQKKTLMLDIHFPNSNFSPIISVARSIADEQR